MASALPEVATSACTRAVLQPLSSIHQVVLEEPSLCGVDQAWPHTDFPHKFHQFPTESFCRVHTMVGPSLSLAFAMDSENLLTVSEHSLHGKSLPLYELVHKKVATIQFLITAYYLWMVADWHERLPRICCHLYPAQVYERALLLISARTSLFSSETAKASEPATTR